MLVEILVSLVHYMARLLGKLLRVYFGDTVLLCLLDKALPLTMGLERDDCYKAWALALENFVESVLAVVLDSWFDSHSNRYSSLMELDKAPDPDHDHQSVDKLATLQQLALKKIKFSQ